MDTVSSIPSPMLGFGILGSITETPSYLPAILLGEYDRELSSSIFMAEFKTPAKSENDLKTPFVLEKLELIKIHLRRQVQSAIDSLSESPLVKPSVSNRPVSAQAAHKFRSMSKPAPEGTVAELALKFNTTKAHVRTLKREGRLSELFQ